MSTVIKVGFAGPVLKRLTTVDLADHLAEADSVIDEAKSRGERIVAEASAKADGIRGKAHNEGFEEGYKRGVEEGRQAGHDKAFKETQLTFAKEHERIVADMCHAATQLSEMKEDVRLAAEQDLLSFAVRLASKLTFAIGTLHHESVQQNLKRSLTLIASKTNVVVRVHPDDLSGLQTFAANMLDLIDSAEGVRIVADETISAGGCLVEAERTSVDATLESQINEMVSLLTGCHTEGTRSMNESGDS